MKKLMVVLLLLMAVTALSFAQFAITPEGFVYIGGGFFAMGSPSTERGRSENEFQHMVIVGSFYMGIYEVTQWEYFEIMGTSPSSFSGINRPVENVSWFDAIEYCNKRSQKEGLTPAYTISGAGVSRTVIWNRSANGYRLPTEAEWEYACRAGTRTAYNTGDTIRDSTGWYNDNSSNRTHVVGSNPPNAWGLYDMHGNVWEWCWDWYDAYYYRSSPSTDPAGPSSGITRVLRGGSWILPALNARSAYRNGSNPDGRSNFIGFRVVRSYL